LLPFCRPSFPPFVLYGHLFFFDASPDQVSQSGAAGAAAVLTSIEGMHPRSEESWWGRWRYSSSRTVDSSTLHVLRLQHLRAVALDVATYHRVVARACHCQFRLKHFLFN
jgi:hypothetical protein